MSVLVYRDKSTAGAAAATLIAAQMIEKPTSVFGFDFADELYPVYRALARMTSDGLLDWSDTTCFSLAENVCGKDESFIHDSLCSLLYDKVNTTKSRLFSPAASANNWCAACNQYEEQILQAGGIDLLFLSVKADGSVV